MDEQRRQPLTWEEVERQVFTDEEIAASRARVDIICSFIDARKEKGLSQKELAALTGVKQPAIARLENGNISPSIDTLSKLLAPLGKRLAVVDA
ncbi:MAG: helix-turn-helix transcriptional regulator [Clostridia bacterium]|nr:helix-turn-helix transcriptional regulator [Clostridia bacterium]